MLNAVRENLRKLIENDALGLMIHPAVLANHVHFGRELERRPQRMRAMPSSIEIELTNRCNLACIQCLRSKGLKPYALGEISEDQFLRILDQFPRLLALGLNGFGEPLLHPRFFELAAHARARLPWAKIFIYSNGQLLDQPTAARLVRSGLTEISVSIDAASPRTYHRVRRGGELEDVHAGLRRLLEARKLAAQKLPLVTVNFVMLNENEGELVPFLDQAKAIGVDFVNCISYASYDWGHENRRDKESYGRELAAARRRLGELGLRCRSFPTGDWRWTDPARPFDCGFFWGESVRLTWDGSMTLGCCTPFKETYSFGNVLEMPFRELWNGPEMVRFRELVAKHVAPTAACASCDRFGKTFFEPRLQR